MSSFKNSRTKSFLGSIPIASLDIDTNDLTKRCKFNFSYMDFSQSAGQKFNDSAWNLVKLLDRVHYFSKEPLKYWKSQYTFVVYGDFPAKSHFTHPRHVPHQVEWARFRLASKIRLAGFIIPAENDGEFHKETGYRFDCNTFYVVFLDKDHKFYPVEKK